MKIAIVILILCIAACSKVHEKCIEKYAEDGNQSNDLCKFIQKDDPGECQARIDENDSVSQSISLGLGGVGGCKRQCEGVNGGGCGYYCEGLCEGDYGPIRNPNTTLDVRTETACRISLEDSGFREIATPSSAACHRFCLQGTIGGCDEYCGRLCAGEYQFDPDFYAGVFPDSSKFTGCDELSIKKWIRSKVYEDHLYFSAIVDDFYKSNPGERHPADINPSNALTPKDYLREIMAELEVPNYQLINHSFSPGESVWYFTDRFSWIEQSEDVEKSWALNYKISETKNQNAYGYIQFPKFYSLDTKNELQEKFSDKLSDVFKELNSKDIDTLVVDLRYNTGGSVGAANYFSSLITESERNENEVFIYMISKFDLSPIAINYTNNFGIDFDGWDFKTERIYFLTNKFTCSASELTINSILTFPSIDVYQIGSKTCGKPIGFKTVEHCDMDLNIMSLAFANGMNNGDYYNGLAPVLSNEPSQIEVDGCLIEDDSERLFLRFYRDNGYFASNFSQIVSSGYLSPEEVSQFGTQGEPINSEHLGIAELHIDQGICGAN